MDRKDIMVNNSNYEIREILPDDNLILAEIIKNNLRCLKMDKLVRKIEIPLAKNAIEKAGLYIVQEKDLDRLAEGQL